MYTSFIAKLATCHCCIYSWPHYPCRTITLRKVSRSITTLHLSTSLTFPHCVIRSILALGHP